MGRRHPQACTVQVRYQAVGMVHISWLLLGALMLPLTGCSVLERIVSDSATRLAYEVRDEAQELRRSGETKRTFVHQPKEWPDGLAGDYRIEIRSTPTPLNPPEKRSIMTANSLDGHTRSGTSYHLNYVVVPQDLVVRHRKGEPTLVTLEMRDGKVALIALD